MISVIMPTYNCASTIRQAITSILRQSVTEFELLVLDDGSTDGTRSVVEAMDDPRIVYIPLPHIGFTAALNTGLSSARFEIIARMDADDLSLPHRFERQLEVLQRSPSNAIVSSWYAMVSDEKVRYIVETPLESSMVKRGLTLHSPFSHPGMMCRSAVLKEHGGYIRNPEVDAFVDYTTWLSIKDSVEFINIPEVLLFQRFRSRSLSNNPDYRKKAIYTIQQPYYDDLQRSFGITQPDEQRIIRGWREYFFHDRTAARAHWNSAWRTVLRQPHVILAWLLTLLPERIFQRLLESRVRYRLSYYRSYFSARSTSLRDALRNVSGE